jgi:phage replication-related protein YjqB (UPF0714/DUF867 family)
MPRTPNTTVIENADPTNPAYLAQLEKASEVGAIVDAAQAQAIEVGRYLGRIETSQVISHVSAAISLSAYETLKKSKSYLHITNHRDSHGENFKSLEEFCEVMLGVSYKTMQRNLAHRNLLGEELYEQAQTIGLRTADFAAIKALPSSKRDIIDQAIAEGSTRDEVIKALCELTTKDQEEIDTLKNRAETAEAEGEAKDKVMKSQSEKINKLEIKNAITADVDWTARTAGLSAQIANAYENIKLEFTKLSILGDTVVTLADDTTLVTDSNREMLRKAQTELLKNVMDKLIESDAVVQTLNRRVELALDQVAV